MTGKIGERVQTAGALTCPSCGAAAAPEAAVCLYCDRPLAIVGCGTCFARLHEGMAFCPSCGNRSSRADGGHPAVMACPGCATNRCTSMLNPVSVGAHMLHECVACHGLWLDTNAVATLERDANTRSIFSVSTRAHKSGDGERRDKGKSTGTSLRYRRCPVCADVMSRVNVARISGVIVDRCNDHGTYFDVDELYQLVQFLEGGGIDRARARERQALADERRHLQFMMDLDQKRKRFEASPRSETPSFTAGSLLVSLARKLLEE